MRKNLQNTIEKILFKKYFQKNIFKSIYIHSLFYTVKIKIRRKSLLVNLRLSPMRILLMFMKRK